MQQITYTNMTITPVEVKMADGSIRVVREGETAVGVTHIKYDFQKRFVPLHKKGQVRDALKRGY